MDLPDGDGAAFSLPVLSAELIADVAWTGRSRRRVSTAAARRSPYHAPSSTRSTRSRLTLARPRRAASTATWSRAGGRRVCSAGAARDLSDQHRQAVQHDVQALPRGLRPGPRRGEHGPRGRRRVPQAIDHIQAHPDGGSLHTVDLTGGAPELNPHFEYLVDECVARGLHVIDRCNLTILTVGATSTCPSGSPSAASRSRARCPTTAQLGTDAQRAATAPTTSPSAPSARSTKPGYGQGDPNKRADARNEPSRQLPRRRAGVPRGRVESGAATATTASSSTASSRSTTCP